MALVKRINKSVSNLQISAYLRDYLIRPLIHALFIQEYILEYLYTDLCEGPHAHGRDVRIFTNRHIYPAFYSISVSTALDHSVGGSVDDIYGILRNRIMADNINLDFYCDCWLKGLEDLIY